MAAHVTFQPTPNPNAGKFVLDRKIMPAGRSRSFFPDEDDPAGDSPAESLARALMALPGVRSLFMVDDFVTVSKTPGAHWDDLVPRVTAVIEATL